MCRSSLGDVEVAKYKGAIEKQALEDAAYLFSLKYKYRYPRKIDNSEYPEAWVNKHEIHTFASSTWGEWITGGSEKQFLERALELFRYRTIKKITRNKGKKVRAGNKFLKELSE